MLKLWKIMLKQTYKNMRRLENPEMFLFVKIQKLWQFKNPRLLFSILATAHSMITTYISSLK